MFSFLYSPTLTSIHDYWKKHTFNYMDFCWQSNVCFLIPSTTWTFVGKVMSLLFNMLSAAAAAKSLQSCLTLRDPIDGSPPGSPVPGILQARNTGVGCHFLLQCMKVESEREVAQSCPTLSDPMNCSPPRFLHPWDFPGKSTGVGCHCLL